MAMNKSECAHLEALQNELRAARAFRFTEAVTPDVEPPETGDQAIGWTFNLHTRCVKPACTGRTWHYIGAHERPEDSGSRGSRRLYSTRLLALRALRHAMEQQFASELAAVDADIEKESQT